MTIGKAYESTKIEVQECSANRPPAKESIKAGAHGQTTRPHLGSSLQKVKEKIIFKTQRSIKEV